MEADVQSELDGEALDAEANVGVLLDRWIGVLVDAGQSFHTVLARHSDVVRFLAIVAPSPSPSLERLQDPSAVGTALTKLTERVTPKAASRIRSSVRAFFSWLAEGGAVPAVPDCLSDRRSACVTGDQLRQGEIARLLDAAAAGGAGDRFHPERDVTLVLVLTRTTVPVRRVLLLDWTEVDFESRSLVIVGGRPRRCPLDDETVAALDRLRLLCPAGGNVFVQSSGAVATENWLRGLLEVLFRRIGSTTPPGSFARSIRPTKGDIECL